MIMAPTGEVCKVVGSRRDMAPTGPMPGRTPISVPMKTPIKQYRRLTGMRETEKP
jgi:hypothetical protein